MHAIIFAAAWDALAFDSARPLLSGIQAPTPHLWFHRYPGRTSAVHRMATSSTCWPLRWRR
jgi:hypothetical protein